MRWRLMAFTIAVAFIVVMTGCYTVVMMPSRTVHRVETRDVIVDDEPYEDVIEEYEDESTVIHEHYIYGDLWPYYTSFDPFWSSPYWWHYSSSWRWRYSAFYHPWSWYSWWDPWYSGIHWGGYYGSYGSWYAPYYMGHYDPYWAYWDGYAYGRQYKKQPFGNRETFRT